MNLDALRYGDFSRLGEAVTDWEQMTQKLADLMESAQENLKVKADKAKWAGVNATVSREFVDRTVSEFADAHTQASSITKILSDTRSELLDYRTQVNDAIDRGAKRNLTVVDTGAGTFTVSGNTRPDWASDPGGESGATDQQAVDDLRDEIQRILGKATESDDSAAKVLNLLVDQAEYGFSDAAYADRDSAAQAVAAAETLAKQAKDPASMSLDDIAAFNHTMGRYSGDSLFAEQLARQLGSKGTLQFWTEMTYAHAGARGSELDTMKTLQKNLSLTLATASFSDSDAMQKWKRNLIAERNTNFLSGAAFSPIGALGSQVISSLMREGEYDTEFLDDYREELFKADKAAGSAGTNDLWTKGYDALDVVFGEGNGRDPMEGLFDGLSHSPEAARHAFESKADLDHMLSTTRYTERGASLGRALEAAVTGLSRGDTQAVAPPHNETQLQIMQNVMGAVAQPGGGDLVRTGLGTSLGNMAAAYMPEISNALSGSGAESVFLTNSDEPDGFNHNVRDVTRFLSCVSEDPAGRAGIILGESLYTSGLIESHLADPDLFDGSHEQVLQDIGRNAGTIEGIVAHSVAEGKVHAAVEGENTYNEALKTKGDFAKTWISVGMTFVQVPEAYGGAAMGAVVGGGVGAVAGAAVDRLLDGQKMNGARDAALYESAGELYDSRESVNRLTQWAAEESIDRYHVDVPRQATMDTIRVAVNAGWNDGSHLLDRTRDLSDE
ncbi:hypothetical protein ACIP10_21790 [Streptomyces galbus]|uniref:hypothetical protein n=1 Tax=Streptomyces galbus TaxID=33898 RepID=UPI00379CBB94